MVSKIRWQDKVLALAAAMVITVGATGCGKGQGKNPKIDGVIGPNVSFYDNKFVLTMALQNLNLDGGVRIPIPKMPGSYVEFGPDFQSNGTLIGIGVDARDLVALTGNQAHLLDPLTLPGGRPLPGIADGFLPGLAVQVPKWKNIAFYAAKTLFGVFVPVNLPWDGIAGTFRFYDGAGDRIGNLSLVGKDDHKENSGVLLLVDLSGKVGKMAGIRL